MGKYIRRVLMVILLAVFLVSAGMVGRDLYIAHREKQTNQSLVDQVHSLEAAPDATPKVVERAAVKSLPEPAAQTDEDTETGLTEEDEAVEMLPQYAWIWELNQDFAGWLRIDGTEVDYPVMYTPEDEEYYLRRDFYGKDARSGTLFIGAPWKTGHTIIYGHNMKNDTMLGTLTRYEEQSFMEAHPIIQFDTLTREGEYQVLAAFRSRAAQWSSEGIFPYWMYQDLQSEEAFAEYVENVKALSLYDTGVDAAFGDTLLTISTCSYHTTDGRFVVVAKKIA